MTDVSNRPRARTSPIRSHTSTSTKGVTLNSRIASIAALLTVAAVSAGSALAGTAQSTKIVPFTGTYAGIANVVVADGLSTITATGVGKSVPVGMLKLTGKGTGSADENAECNPFNGTGSITGLKSAKINYKLSGAQGCGDGTDFSITGRAIVTGGAGAYKTAKGNLKVVGSWNKSTKKFSIKFIGKLTV
jgi:hypothetical protein